MAENDKQRPKKVMPRSPGRPKGVPNKTTTLLKEAVLKAAAKAGGRGGLVAYLEARAIDQPAAFMSLLGRVLPLQVAGDPDNPLHTVTEIVERIVDPKGKA